MESIGFIGIGNMGLAILKGLKLNSFEESGNPKSQRKKPQIAGYGYDAFAERKSVAETHGAAWLNSEIEVAERCKYILLAVKPQSVGEVLGKIAPVLKANSGESVIISICAGISADFIRARTSESQKVVRVMPNTPMMLGEGACAVSADETVTIQELDFACYVLNRCSPSVEVIPESQMNAIIAINGSSPAFIYLFAKCFTDYAKEQGIPEHTALNLFSQTLAGSAKMLTKSGFTADELIAQVSSKGGTTVAGLEQLREKGLPEAVKAACEACTKRANELANY